MWAECAVPLNACVIRFWNKKKKPHSITFSGNPLSLSRWS
jgi:hypothetical protein